MVTLIKLPITSLNCTWLLSVIGYSLTIRASSFSVTRLTSLLGGENVYVVTRTSFFRNFAIEGFFNLSFTNQQKKNFVVEFDIKWEISTIKEELYKGIPFSTVLSMLKLATIRSKLNCGCNLV